jgi:hypothetical protein
MDQSLGDAYLLELLKGLKGLKRNAELAMEQISEEEMHYRRTENSNSVAILIKHISGNMRSRFTDFLTTDGEKPDRNRDGEFTRERLSREELIRRWDEAWQILFDTLATLKPDDLLNVVSINKEQQTVVRALQRALVHYANHTGQIVYICKEIRDPHFKTLSIPLKKWTDR